MGESALVDSDAHWEALARLQPSRLRWRPDPRKPRPFPLPWAKINADGLASAGGRLIDEYPHFYRECIAQFCGSHSAAYPLKWIH